MNHTDQNNDFFNDDVIDSIADGVPVERRAAFYREMRHLRVLPHSDEMLHIVYILQFPMLMMVEIPKRLAIEREKLERATGECMVLLQGTNERLARLPDEVASGIAPEAIAEKINESLRQQFIQSTIPETAQMLGIIAKENKRVSAEFASAASKLEDSCNGSATNAGRTIANIDRAATRLSREYRWAVLSLCGLTSAVSIALGMLLQWWVFTAPQQVEHIATPQVQSAPATANPADRPKNRR